MAPLLCDIICACLVCFRFALFVIAGGDFVSIFIFSSIFLLITCRGFIVGVLIKKQMRLYENTLGGWREEKAQEKRVS